MLLAEPEALITDVSCVCVMVCARNVVTASNLEIFFIVVVFFSGQWKHEQGNQAMAVAYKADKIVATSQVMVYALPWLGVWLSFRFALTHLPAEVLQVTIWTGQ